MAAERWGVPLVQSMHTLGKVKNLALATGDCAEPAARIRGEGEVIAAADRLVANTAEEARQLIELYGADPWRVETVNPGVDLSVFRPASAAPLRPRRGSGCPPDAVVLVFAGRIQPLKGPDIVLHAAAELLRSVPALAGRLVVVFVGGPSGSEVGAPGRLSGLAERLGIARTACGWSRRARSGSWPTGTGPRTSCWCRRTRSRSGWWRWRLRRAARRWWRPRSGGCAPRSGTDTPACWSTGTIPCRRRGCWPSSWRRRRGWPSCRGARVAHASAFDWPATADRLVGVYTGAMNEAAAPPWAHERVEAVPPGCPATSGAWRPVRASRWLGQARGWPLDELGLTYESPQPGAYLVRLEGQHKLATMTWLIVGSHSLSVEAFFCRQPDENHEAFYRFLLERNGRMYGVHFSLDPVGDVYLTGRLPLSGTSAADIDRLLGCVLSYADDNFDTALELGFASSIRREWAWRAKRGESLANLRAFARFADPDR